MRILPLSIPRKLPFSVEPFACCLVFLVYVMIIISQMTEVDLILLAIRNDVVFETAEARRDSLVVRCAYAPLLIVVVEGALDGALLGEMSFKIRNQDEESPQSHLP